LNKSNEFRHPARKVGIDYGLFIPLASEMDVFIALPWLGFTVPFDKKKK